MQNQMITQQDTFQNTEGYLEVSFNTNSTVSRVAPSPTRKVQNYGAWPTNAKLWVHQDDQRRLPSLYVPVPPKRKAKGV
jgi:hypothetical protein